MEVKSSRLMNITASFILVSLIVYILYIGRELILPFVLALVIWYMIVQFAGVVTKLHIGNKKLPAPLCYGVSMLAAFALMYLFMYLLTASIGNIIDEAPAYQAKLKGLLGYINQWTGSQLNATQLLNGVNLTTLFSKLAMMASSLIGNFTLVLIYLLFLALETKSFHGKLAALCNKPEQAVRMNALLHHIGKDINAYLKAKTLLNALAGVASYIVLRVFHVPYAEFWGMLFFLSHFIPFIGSIVAVILVMLAASIQVSDMVMFSVLASILVAIQFLVGNVLEPKWLGDRLNLSPIVILLSLAFWGSLWGVLGMFLCVPLMVILNIVFANFAATRFIAVLLSDNPAEKYS